MTDPDELALMRAEARLDRRHARRAAMHSHPNDPSNPAWDYDDDQATGDESDEFDQS